MIGLRHFLVRLLVVGLQIGALAGSGAAMAAVDAAGPSATTPAPATMAAPAATDVPPDYLLGPGDTIQVFVWRNPELTISVPVRPDGKISTPLVDDMVAIGKTPSQLARDLEVVLSEYVLAPKVNIIVMTSASAANQIKLVGQVRVPQSMPYRAGMTALDAVMAAGGITEFASGNRAKILRKNPQGQQQSIKLRIADLVKGKLQYNVPLRPGDVLVIPEALF